MIVVADTGPLLALAKIDRLSLLFDLYQSVIIGPSVYKEAVMAGLAMNAADAVLLQQAHQAEHLVVKSPQQITLPYPGQLHAGEAESISLAIELEATWLLADDLDARTLAQQNFAAAGVKTGVKGTLGLIVTAATQTETITTTEAIDLVQKLKNRPDIWLAPALCEMVIQTLQRSSK